MSTRYNAFISYKHAEEDNKVAEAVHKGLERFHIPGKIRKKTGIKRIDRIFRDKDELPITSDLSDSIAEALSSSDYLIVICSTNTKESAWVPREIEYFLKNHSRREVFTVLVNGEPGDVIPEILTYEEKTIPDEDGNDRTVRIPVEPLSCDFRMSAAKAKRTELPRLAAGIIGCAYDELMNRRRQYRMKQLFAFFCAALILMAAFCGYMYYSRDKIHKNYLESLRNQSKYLANESTRLLEKEQRITALQLALEALPSDKDDDRPVTAEAVRALTEASLAYEGNNGNNTHAAWNYRMPGVVSEFKLSGNGKKLAARDAGDVVALWDTEDGRKILYLEDQDSGIVGMDFLNDFTFAFWDPHVIRCYDADKGEELWTYTAPEDHFLSERCVISDDGTFYLYSYDECFYKIDIKTGELAGKISLKERKGFEDLSITEAKLSPDAKRIAFRGGGKDLDDYSYGVIELDPNGLDPGKPVLSGIQSEWIRDIAWIDNDTLLLASSEKDTTKSTGYGDMEILSVDHSKISCLDASSLSEKWNADFECTGVMIESGFVMLGNGDIAYFSGNVVSVYDALTGQKKYSSNVNSAVLHVSDRDGDGIPLYITENGGYAVPAAGLDPDAVYYRKLFTDELREVTVCKGVYAKQRYSHEIIYYGTGVYDEEWRPLCEDAGLNGTLMDFSMDDRYLTILTYDDPGIKLHIFSLDEEAGHIRIPLDGEKAFDYSILGIRGDHVYLGYNDDGDYDLITVDIKAEEAVKTKLFKMATSFSDAAVMKDGRLIFIFRTDDLKTGLAVYDPDTGKRNDMILPEDLGYITHAPVYYGEERLVCLYGGGDFVIDVNSGRAETVKAPENRPETSCYSDNSYKGQIAISDGKNIYITGKDGSVSATIKCPGLAPLGIIFVKDALYVLYSDGGFYRYSIETGRSEAKGDASVYQYYNGSTAFTYDKDNDHLFISMEGLLDMVDMETAMETAHIVDGLGYHKGRDIFITTSQGIDGYPEAGYFRRYTVNELIDKARSILKDEELPDDMRSFYGILKRTGES